jgi:uncharacterized membrane protein
MNSLPLPSPLRRRWFFHSPQPDPVLALSMLFSCLLVVARIWHTGRLTFIFMTWNLFLAYVPYWISSQLTRMDTRRYAFMRVAGLVVWLLFIPNSFYILTDLYHLADGHRNARVPEWFDLALILSFAWNGLLLGVKSTCQIEMLLAPDASFAGRWILLYPIMFLNALGVYIGRDLRYNSWDIVTNPVDLLGDIAKLLVHPMRFHYAWGMIFCFSVLLTLMYSLLTKNREPWKI